MSYIYDVAHLSPVEPEHSRVGWEVITEMPVEAGRSPCLQVDLQSYSLGLNDQELLHDPPISRQ